MIFTPLPDEYIASAVRRGNEILGVKGLNKNDYHINKKPRTPKTNNGESVIEYPDFLINLDITEVVLFGHTLYPLAAALGRTRASCIYTPRTKWKICPQCIIDDLDFYGTAFIHRSHIIGSVHLCSTHAITLMQNCPACLKSINQHSISGFIKCSELYKNEPARLTSPRHQYAIFLHELAKYNHKPHNTWTTEPIIWRKLAEIGYYNGKDLDESSVEKMVKEKFNIYANLRDDFSLSLDACALIAYLAFETADAYLSAISEFPTQKYF